MIIYFVDRFWSVAGMASTDLKGGLYIDNDEKDADIDSGVASLTFDLYYPPSEVEKAKGLCAEGNYLLRQYNDDFEVYTIIETENDRDAGYINVYAEDAGLDLLNEICTDRASDGAHTAEYYILEFAGDSGFEIGVNEIPTLSRNLSWEGEATATERIRSVATQFDAEIGYSYEIDKLQVVHKYINIYKSRGKDVGLELRYGREIENIKETRSIADLATALVATGGIPDDEDQAITLKGYTYDDGDIYNDGGVLKSRSALQTWSRFPNEPGRGHLTATYSYDTVNQSTLCSKAVAYLKKMSQTTVNYEIDMYYLPKNLKLGDTVRVVDPKGNLFLSTRVLELKESASDDTHKATFGEFLLKDSGISESVTEIASDRLAAIRAMAASAQATANEAKTTADNVASVAQEAKTTAEEAQTTADSVLEVAESAQLVANTASANATQAQTTASAAQSAAENAQTTAESAKSSAENAKSSAENALTTANNAQSTAAEASTTASTATTTATEAKTIANVASETANAAAHTADTATALSTAALETANGKSTSYYQDTAPTGNSLTAGDLWFDTDDDNAVYRYSGTEWVKAEFGDAAFSNIDAGKIATGTMSAARIKGGTLTLGGVDNGNGLLEVYDENGDLVGAFDKSGLTAKTLVADDYVYVDGNEESMIKIPILNDSGVKIGETIVNSSGLQTTGEGTNGTITAWLSKDGLSLISSDSNSSTIRIMPGEEHPFVLVGPMGRTGAAQVYIDASGNIATTGTILGKATYCQATGSESSATVGTSITQVPLDTIDLSNGDFEISANGIKVNTAGVYRVSASCYIVPAAATTRVGVYVKVGSTFSVATEVNGTLINKPSQSGAGGHATASKLVEISAGDIVFLGARCIGTAGTCQPNNTATFINLEKVG